MKTLIDREDLIFSPPQLGCVLYLPGLPGGGSKIHDRSPYGNHGAITGATWVYQNGIWCLSLDGTDDLITVGHTPSLSFTTNGFSAEAWVKGNSSLNSGAGIFSKYGGTGYWELRASLKHPCFVLWDGTNNPSVRDNSTDLDDEVWHHLVAVRDSGTKLYVYVDGHEGDSDTDTAGDISNTSDLIIGQGGSGSKEEWGGLIALLRAYNRPLTALEVHNHFNREKHLFGVW